ncbi:hypothetical protein MKW94_012759 [Papaver nudicaule]|uniref:H15 domain-containing protein n=1 Tax=Papaver nudicaule TaxID=74823 RepID=A0AA41VM33_PAPNU|nr:hypothetical protein [Papaver nudicaule]
MSKASHPSYFQMIKEALVALNEKNGSSPHAIAKFISQKHKNLPSNFNKMLGVQLKNCTANGKLTKVKSSFKLSDASKQVKPTKSAPAKPTKVVPKAKKPAPVKASDASHPTYFQMIKEAILALKERSGSSPYAIAKYMEEKHSKILPANFKKLLAVQLKNCVANGKLIKMKASFKLSDASKKDVKAVPKPVAAKKKPTTKPKTAAAVAAKAKAGKKPASTAAPTKKKPAAGVSKKAASKKPAAGVAKKAASKKPAGVVAKKAAGSKKPAGAVAKKAGVKKKTKAATPKKRKSVRSPAAKRARRG